MDPFAFKTVSLVLVSILLVILNGLFVAAEFAIVKVRRTRLEELAGQGLASARISILCVDHLDTYLSATQLGITLVSLALGWVGEHAFFSLFIFLFPALNVPGAYQITAVGLSFFVITLLHVVLGELVPKSLAIQDAEKFTLLLTAPLTAFYKLAKPFIWIFTALANLILKVAGYSSYEEPALSESELKLVMRESKEDGVISDNEAQIIIRAFEFSDKRVEQIMVSTEKVNFISLARPLDQNLSVVKSNMHTRFPLCQDSFEKVIGIVHLKDVWPLLLEKFSNEAFEKSARPPIFVNANLRQDQLLKLFQSCRAHMAIVRDAQNVQNLGIVTMEDVLEELVGDIRDEHGN